MKSGSIINSDNRKKIINLCYSLGATAIFNVVIQFVLYPFLEKKMGEDSYGVALSVLSFIAILSGACGYAVGCARLLRVDKGRENNGTYNIILICMGLLCSIAGAVYLWTIDILSPLNLLLFSALSFLTMLRFYSDVEFRLNTDFFRYLVYYVLIALGYVAGIFLFNLSGQWMLALMAGELLCFVYAVIRCQIYRPPFFKISDQLKKITSSISFILLSTFIDNITLHADRIVLLAITGDGAAVTTYYIASLVGKIIAMLTTPINTLVISYLVRYKGGFTKKLWTAVTAATVVGGVVAFFGCWIASPILIKILYPDNLADVRPYLISAILGQVLYFVSGVLMTILLRFKGEKKQFIFNAAYAVEFFICVITGTVLGGLPGFAWAIVIANGIRFVAAVIWGFIGKKQLGAQLDGNDN